MTSLYSDNFKDQNERPIEGAQVYVYEQFGPGAESSNENLPEATITTADDVPVTQPLLTDANGEYSFKAANGLYRIDMWFGGKKIYSSGNVVVGDPALAYKGDAGPSGPADNTYTSLVTFKAQDTSNVRSYLALSGQSGNFIFDSSNLSAEVTSDPAGGVYIAPDSDATGASGAWVRQYDVLQPEFFGDVGNGTSTSANTAMKRWVDYAVAKGLKYIAARGEYYMPAGAQTIAQYAVSKGDPTLDIPLLYGVVIDEANKLTIDLSGAVIRSDHGTPFAMYASADSHIKYGTFIRTGSDANVTTHQASAVAIIRSWKCSGTDQYVTGFYRNLLAYRAPACGFKNYVSLDARYYNAYAASVVDITIPNSPVTSGNTTFMYLNNGYVRGGRYGNIFTDNAEAKGNKSYSCTPSGNTAAHFKTEKMNIRWIDNEIYESSVQNTGTDVVVGLQAIPSGIFGTSPTATIHNNKVRGCYQGIVARGLIDFSITLNDVKGYFQTGIAMISDVTDLEVRRGIIASNLIGAMADTSTRANAGNDKNCGLQIEKNAGVALTDLVVAHNTIDALGTNVTKTPSYSVYVECDAGSVIGLGTNVIVGSLPKTIPIWAYETSRGVPYTTFTSAGTGAAPVAIDEKYCLDGMIRTFSSHLALPAAQAGMRITISSETSASYIYVNGASSGATGSNSIQTSGLASTSRNIQLPSARCTIVLVCSFTGKWDAAPANGTTITVTA